MNVRALPLEQAASRLPLGHCVLDVMAGELYAADGQIAELRKQALEVLLLLGRRSGQVVGKDELIAQVWPQVVVGDGSLTQAIADIRRALGDDDHRLVRNVARRGYMLVPSGAAAPHPPASPVRGHTRRRVGWIAAALLLVAAVAGVALAPRSPSWQTPAAAALPPLPSQVPALAVAVLPLTVESASEADTWLADALHGDLITELTRSPGYLVIARDTMATYKGKPIDARQLARELGVRHILRGSLRREDSRIRLNLALVDGESGLQRWADTLVSERAELPRTLGDFAVQIERTIQAEFYRVSAAQRATLSPDQVSADDLAIQGVALWYRGLNRDNVLQALDLMERAVRLDPDSVRAWSGVGYLTVHAMLNGWRGDRASALERIEAAAGQLERIDRNGHYTYQTKVIPLFLKGDVAAMLLQTEAWTQRLTNPAAFGAHGAALMFNGRFDEAAHALERALRLSPRDPLRAEWHYRLAMAHFSAGRHELARDWATTGATLNPGLRWPPIHAAALWRLGQADAAREVFADYERRHGAFQAAQVRPRLPGNDPRFSEARERLVAALAATAAR